MLPNTALYAAKKRKKPVQKIPRPPPPDGVKSNPSKRHRDRLNSELDKLTALLPFSAEVRGRLDKLSVLRLSVGFLRVKSFFNAVMKASPVTSGWKSERLQMFQKAPPPSSFSSSSSSSSSSSLLSSLVTSIDGVNFSEGDLLLQALNGFVLVVTAEGSVFYTSTSIQEYLGFHQSDVLHQSVFELIHTDDRAVFRRQLHFSLNTDSDDPRQSSAELSSVTPHQPADVPPENSSFLERNFCCRFRCLLDNSSGFLALKFCGRLKFLHGQSRVSDDGFLAPPQLALFAVATPLETPSILEIRTKTLIFQTKHKMDFTPMGIDSRGKTVLGYSEMELRMKGSGYNFIHAADMMFCADNHIRMIKTGDTGFNVFRLLTKSRSWIWVQAHARVVFKGGKPDFIVSRQRPLTNEEGEEQLRVRRLQLPFNFTTGEALLYDTTPSLDPPPPGPGSAPKQRKLWEGAGPKESLLSCMLGQDRSAYCQHGQDAIRSLNDAAFQDSHATLSVPGQSAAPPEPGGQSRADEALLDMMDTLQQILGDGELTAALEVAPDELKSWEAALLNVNLGAELGDDLGDVLNADVLNNDVLNNDILNNDILSYVEEQLQKEAGLPLDATLDAVPDCLSALDLQNQNTAMNLPLAPPLNAALDPPLAPTLALPLDSGFSWGAEPHSQQLVATPPEAVSRGTVRLSHLDFPPLPNTVSQLAPPPCMVPPYSMAPLPNMAPPLLTVSPSPTSCHPPRRPAVPQNSSHFPVSSLACRTAASPQPLPQMTLVGGALNDQSAARPLRHAFVNQWSSATPPFPPSVSNDFPVDPAAPSGLQRRFALQGAWPEELCLQQEAGLNQISTLPQNAVNMAALSAQPAFRTPEMPLSLFAAAADGEASSSCLYRNATPLTQPFNGLHTPHINPAPANANANHINHAPSKPACFYQSLPAGSAMTAIPAMTAVPHPDEAAMACQREAGLNANGLMAPPYAAFREQTQVNGCPVVAANGGFFTSPPNGNNYYPDSQ